MVDEREGVHVIGSTAVIVSLCCSPSVCPAHIKLFGTKGPDGVISNLQEMARTV